MDVLMDVLTTKEMYVYYSTILCERVLALLHTECLAHRHQHSNYSVRVLWISSCTSTEHLCTSMM